MKPALTKEAAIYSIPSVIRILGYPISMFFYTRILTKSDYGILGLMTVTAGLMTIFTNWGLVNGMVRFMGEPGEELNKLVGTSYYGSLLAGVAVFAVFFLGQKFFTLKITGSIKYTVMFILIVSSVIFSMAYQTLQNLLRMQKKVVPYVVLESANFLFNLVLGVYLVYFLKLGLWGVAISGFAVVVLFALIVHYYFSTHYKMVLSWTHFKKLASYGAPFTIITLGAWFLDWSDRYILKIFVSMGDLGLYHVAYHYGIYTQALVTPFILAVLPYLFDYHREGTYNEKTGELALNYIIFYTGIVLLLSFFAKPYFLIVTPPKFHAAMHIAPWISLCYAWRGLFNIFCFRNTLTGNARAQFFIEISSAVLNIVLNFAMIPFLGIYGAVIATVLAWVWMLAYSYYYNQKHLPIHMPGKKAVRTLGAGLVCFLLIFFTGFYPVWPLGFLFFGLYLLYIHYRIYSLAPLFNILMVKQR